MNPLPDKDQSLIDFLRQNQPQPPPASSDLEDHILNAIEQAEQPRRPRSSRRFSRAWLPAAIAASLVGGLLSYPILAPPSPSASELALLEDFIESNWSGSMVGDSEGLPDLDGSTTIQPAFAPYPARDQQLAFVHTP